VVSLNLAHPVVWSVTPDYAETVKPTHQH